MADAIVRPRVFLDLQVGLEPAGRVVVELFADKAPKTCENFKAICTSSYTPPTASKPLTYRLSLFHRVVDKFMIQGGDITAGDGTGGQSIYGGEFSDENIGWREIDTAGLVCMANRGKGTNSSQFFITLMASKHLSHKHTVFGHVISSMDVVNKIAKVKVDKTDRPLEDVLVSHCGEIGQGIPPIPLDQPDRKNVVQSKPNENVDRNGKRTNQFHSKNRGGSRSRSSSNDRCHRRKHSKRLVSPMPTSGRRRSDVAIDETRRGRGLSRSPSRLTSAGQSPADHPHRRNRNISPSRSRSIHNSPSPHLRRPHARSRVQSATRRDRRRVPPRDHDTRRPDESQIRLAEEERDGGRGRYDGVLVDDDHSQSCRERNGGIERHFMAQTPSRHSYGRLGGDGDDEGGSGKVKFKGRGGMKY